MTPRGGKYFNPLSLYRERRVIKDRAIAREGISIHSPYTGRDVERLQDITDEQAISIHSPYTGRDSYLVPEFIQCAVFQSTLPIQGETLERPSGDRKEIISIHSPYTGRDTEAQTALSKFKYFNPLSLYRERHGFMLRKIKRNYFNPLSLYRERRFKKIQRNIRRRNFNPLSLYRERPLLPP